MTKSSAKLGLWMAIGLTFATLGPAMAECRISGPQTMYLGDNASYSLQLVARRGEGCSISFARRTSNISFSSVEVSSPPKAGKFTGRDTFNLFYVPPASGDLDSFSLKVCGTDTHGTGCNVLTYAVAVTQ